MGTFTFDWMLWNALELLASRATAGLPQLEHLTSEAWFPAAKLSVWCQSVDQGSAWLCGGERPSLADLCLFPTLIRWELVYAPLFGCGRQPLWQLPELWRWRACFYQLPGVAATCRPEAWRRDYFGALFPLHPSGIIPAGPDLATLVLSSPPQRLDDQQQP